MSKPYPGDWVIRSALFVPGHIDKMLAKAAGTEADCVLLDLEDAVPVGSKIAAREMVRHALNDNLFSHQAAFVRVNSLETGLTSEDLVWVVCRPLNGIVYPNANRPEDIKELDAQIGQAEKEAGLPIGHLSLMPLIESPQGVLRAFAIAQASPRMVGLIFGCEDYLAGQQARHDAGELALLVPRTQVAVAARAADMEPIDTPYVKVRDLAGLRSFAKVGRDLGMGGMCVLNPDQVQIINEIYTPTDNDVRSARGMIQSAPDTKSAGRGVFLSDGKFISPPTLRAAAKTLARYDAICRWEEFKRLSK